MKHTQQIIQDAIEEGWQNKASIFLKQNKLYCKGEIYADDVCIQEAFLDPLFWQAVGKTRGWGENFVVYKGELVDEWVWKQHDFITHLQEGDDYETALSKLV